MSRWFTMALVAVVLAFAALVAACSDDDEQAQQVAQTSQQQEQEQQPAPAASAQQQQQQQQQAAQTSDDEEAPEPLFVVASTQIVADWVRQIGGDRVEVRALVPAGADVHTLELSVDDIRAIADADLVVINGASLEAAYEDAILENAERVLNLAEAIEERGFELAPFADAMEDDHDDHGHDDEDGHEDDHGDGHVAEAVGRLLIADAIEAHLSVINLGRGDVTSGQFEVAAPNATVYPSPSHRFAIVLARGPEDDDDRVHFFDGGIYLVEHGDHYDLFRGELKRLPLEIIDERPIHYVNSHGWTAIFADASGHVYIINEHELAESEGDYEPIILEAGPHHGAALAISDEHVIVTSVNREDPDDALPVGVEVRDLDDNVVYDASNTSCPGLHGETHNEHGAFFGCVGGVLFIHAHDGEYEHEWVPNPEQMREDSRIGSLYGHHHLEHVFGRASYRSEDGFVDDGVWLIDAAHGEMEQVFAEASVGTVISADGELLLILDAEGALHFHDAHDGEPIAAMGLVVPGENGRPSMIPVGEMLYVSDPNSGHVLGVHLEDMEIEAEYEVGGAPARLAFIGVLDRNAAPDAGHDDHDDHGDEEEHEDHEEGEDGHHHHHHGDEDPHFWFDTELASAAVAAIADELADLGPESADAYQDRLASYLDEIAEADAEVRSLLADIPDEHRLLVTFHDAFGYFADRYGLTVGGFVVEGPEQGVSAAALTELIELIEHEGVTTVFHEPQFDSNILDTIADETGVNVGIIWSQPTDEQPTYIDILLANARAVANQ